MTIELASVLRATWQHLALTGVSVGMAVLVGVPLGAYLTRERFLAGPVLGAIGVLQTVPSIALLGLLIPAFGIGVKPALIALYVYALLPIVSNTFTGLDSVEPASIDSARGMGMRERQVLWHIALPQALPVIMAGIRTSTVIGIGIATLAAYVGAGGLGDFIFRGISMVDMRIVAAGAVPAALLAVLAHLALGLAQRAMTPRGLRDGEP